MEPITASAARLAGSSLLRLQSDDRLARLAALDNHAAFEAIVKRYGAELMRSARRILPDGRAEDAVQQALLKAHEALLRNGPPERLRPWLHRIVANSALDQISDNETVELPPAEQLGGVESAAETHERREHLGAAVAAIGGLPEGQRRAIVARELEGRSHDEIASELGLSRGAARQLIHRARAGVRSAVTALTPVPLLERLLSTGAAQTAPVADIAAGGVATGAAAKVAIAAIVAGGAIGGAALVGPLERSEGEREADARGDDRAAAVADADDFGPGGGAGGSGSGEGGSSGPGGGSESSGGPGPSGDGGHGGNSGPGGGGGDDGVESEHHDSGSDSGSSGSGSSGSGTSGSGSSGSGSSGSGTSGSGSSGSGTSGSGSSGSGTSDSGTSGGGTSGSGTSGSSTSGSGTSGSGTSGSGTSGSESSGSGSGGLSEPTEIPPD